MIVGADIINLSGDHPYYRELGPVDLALPILSRVPGTEVTDRNTTGVDTRRAEDAWSPLAGPYLTIPGSRVSRDQVIVDRRALLGLVWDLRGEPIHPSLGRRAPVEFAAVMELDGRGVSTQNFGSVLKSFHFRRTLTESMTTDTLAKLPNWPALMDLDTTILYLGGSRTALEKLEESGFLRRWQNGHKAVRFLRSDVDTALKACALHEQEIEERKSARKGGLKG